MAARDAGPSAFAPALAKMPSVRDAKGRILSKPFLELCRLILPVLDRLGASMMLAKGDIEGNIARLERAYKRSPELYEYLHDIVNDDVRRGDAKDDYSETNGLLWLTRGLRFICTIFLNLESMPDVTLSVAAQRAYDSSLRQYHGFIATSALTLGISLAPHRSTFMKALGGESAQQDMSSFVTLFMPLLDENLQFLQQCGFGDVRAA